MLARIPLRRRLLLSVVGALALTLLVLVAAFNVVLRERLSQEADNALTARASAELASLRVLDGRLVVAEAPDAAAPDTQAWVFGPGQQVLEQPRTTPAASKAAALLARSGRGSLDPPGTHTRLHAVPVVADGRRFGAVVTAVSLTPYDNTAQTALIGSVALGLLVLAAAAVAARMLISRALAPVSRMTEQAAAWSRIDSGQRFGLGVPRDELTGLAATLDGLLDRVASSLRHEQRFSAELSHELRSPLATVIAEAQHALRHGRSTDEERGGYARILDAAQQMKRTLETLLTAARIEHRPSAATGDAAAAANAAARGCADLAAARGITITVREPEASLTIGVETDVAERTLAPLIENACRYGSRSVTVEVEQRRGAIVFGVRDDGPGIREQDREQIFEPGWRNGSNEAGSQGAGLGLPLARRLARACGGDVYAEDGGGGGRFAVRLPLG